MILISASRAAIVATSVALAVLASGCRSEEPARTGPTEKSTVVGKGVPAGVPALDEPDDDTLSPFNLKSRQIANLDPQLLKAVQAAAREATADGVRFWVTSGWRSREKQQALFDAAVSRYGSRKEAQRYVSTPNKSAHVTGDAVDIGPTDADSWMAQHGSDYGLCQSFANEMWHFELAVEPGGTCPAPLPDSSYR